MKKSQIISLAKGTRGIGQDGAQHNDLGPEHWSKSCDPTTEGGKDVLGKQYNAERVSKDDPEDAAIYLADFYDSLETGTESFTEKICSISGLYQLMRHNPHFRPEAEAMRMMLEGENILNQFAHKVRML